MAESFLSSALDTFVGLRNENRKSQLHDLQMERYQLLNEGSRLSNTFDRRTLDDRVDYEADRARGMDATATRNEHLRDIDAVRLDVEEYLAPHKKREGVASANAEEGRAGYWSAKSREASQLVDANVSKGQADAEKAELELASVRQERWNEVSADTAQHVLNDGSFADAVYNKGRAHGQMVGMANTKFAHLLREGQKVTAIIPNPEAPGYYTLMDNNGKPITVGRMSVEEEDASGASEEQRAVLQLTDRDLVGALFDGETAATILARDAQIQQAMGPVDAQLSAQGEQLGTVRNQRRTEAAQNPALFEQAKDYQSNLAAINARVAEVEQQLETVPEVPGAGGWRDPKRTQLLSTLGELEAARDQLNTDAEEQGYARFLTEEGQADEATFTARQASLSRSMDGLDTQTASLPVRRERERQNVLSAFQADAGASDAQQLTGTDLAQNYRTSGSYNRSPEAAKTELELTDAQTKAVQDTLARVVEPYADVVTSTPTKGGAREMAAERLAQAQQSLKTAVQANPELQRMMRGTPEERQSAEALMGLAFQNAVASGSDVATEINGHIANLSPEAIAAGGAFANDPAFTNDITTAIRYQAVERAMLAVDRGATPAAAKTEALRWAQQQKGRQPEGSRPVALSGGL